MTPQLDFTMLLGSCVTSRNNPYEGDITNELPVTANLEATTVLDPQLTQDMPCPTCGEPVVIWYNKVGDRSAWSCPKCRAHGYFQQGKLPFILEA